MVMLLAALRMKLTRIDGKRLLRLFVVGGASAVGTAAAVHFIGSLVPASADSSHWVSALRVVLLGLGGAWVYLGIGKWMGLDEAKYAFTAIGKRFGKG
jgi:uncharacterized membrane protein YadS